MDKSIWLRGRTFRAIGRYLETLGWIITVIVVLSPRWGSQADDFYLGYPVRFYVTQNDVFYAHVKVLSLLFDLMVVGIPIFAVVHAIVWGLGRIRKAIN